MLQNKTLPDINADSSARSLGLSERTHQSQLSGLERYNEYAEIAKDEPSLKEPSVEYLGGDNARELIVRYMSWLAKTKLSYKNAKNRGIMTSLLLKSWLHSLKKNILKTLLNLLSLHMATRYSSHLIIYHNEVAIRIISRIRHCRFTALLIICNIFNQAPVIQVQSKI